MPEKMLDKVAALKIAFVDRISLLSLVRLLILGRSFHVIRFFDSITPSAHRILKVCNKMGFLHAEVSRVENHIGQARDIPGFFAKHWKSVRR